ncbi:uncharacterized protein LOC119946964 [Tachyglossus aculeatus]|uniref:uncharacterized protein LOC119946964 n=1 Tax=Tachyglossus aculeatus TaxID=9261 RepID=UPI0018F62A86|nr:uncharacterized protein LOC119946964 [Tachyglossus aculeatus]
MSLLSPWLLAIWLLAMEPCSGFTASAELMGVKGESVQLSPEIPAGKEVANIIWNTHVSLAVVQPGTAGSPPKVLVTDSRYQGRVSVSNQSYILHISDLKMEDCGLYKAQINLVGASATIIRTYTLQIYEPLSKPKITRKISRGENGTCNFTLTCSVVGGGANITYSWSSQGLGEALSTNGSILRVYRSPEDGHTYYTCTATNSITRSYEIVDSDELLCPDPLHSPLKAGLAALAILMALVGAFLGYLLFYKKTWKGTNKPQWPKNPEPATEVRVYDEVGPNLAKGLPDRDGNTLYFRISKPEKLPSKLDPVKEKAVNTIYSTVESPKGKPPPTAAKTDALPSVLPTRVKNVSFQQTGVAAPEKPTDKYGPTSGSHPPCFSPSSYNVERQKGGRERGVMIPLLLWLPALLHLQPGATALRELNGTIGGSVTFPLDILAGWQVESIAWTSNGAVTTVIPGRPGDPPEIIATHQRYRGRLSVSTDYSLIISLLSLEDVGTYRADINTANNTSSSQFSLHVYERLAKPTVTVNSTKPDNGSCTITLTCSVARRRNELTFSWTPLGPRTTISSNGSVLSVFQKPGDPPQDYTCTATNPISNSSRTIPADQILCPEAVMESKSNHTTVIVVITVLVLAATLLVGVMVKQWRKKKRQEPEAEIMEGNTVYAQVQHCHPQPEQHQSLQKAPPQNLETTIYSTVQPTKKVESPSTTLLTYEKIV